jgi:hypothetical protein
MRCMLCGAEMSLTQSVPDETMLVPGFEHHTLVCPSCHDEEQRLVFVHHSAPLSLPVEAESGGSDIADATLQPANEGTAVDNAVHEVGATQPAETIGPERPPAISAAPAHQSLTNQHARAANSRVWGSKAELHRARWRELCDRLGLGPKGEKVEKPKSR